MPQTVPTVLSMVVLPGTESAIRFSTTLAHTHTEPQNNNGYPLQTIQALKNVVNCQKLSIVCESTVCSAYYRHHIFDTTGYSLFDQMSLCSPSIMEEELDK